jgi:hypothetical protein
MTTCRACYAQSDECPRDWQCCAHCTHTPPARFVMPDRRTVDPDAYLAESETSVAIGDAP